MYTYTRSGIEILHTIGQSQRFQSATRGGNSSEYAAYSQAYYTYCALGEAEFGGRQPEPANRAFVDKEQRAYFYKQCFGQAVKQHERNRYDGIGFAEEGNESV